MTSKVSQHCLDLVRNRDKVGYLSSRLIYPRSIQPAIIAVRALNVELSSVKDASSSSASTGGRYSSIISDSHSSAGSLKLRWWIDAINALYTLSPTTNESTNNNNGKKNEKPSSLSIKLFQNHPIMKELIDLQVYRYMDKLRLLSLVSARIEDMNSENVFTDLDAMENYAEDTSSSLLYLTLDALQVPRDYNSSIYRAASHAGVAIGITTALRGLPYLLSKGEVRLPQSEMIAHRLSREDIMASFPVLSPAVVAKSMKNAGKTPDPNAFNFTEAQKDKAKDVVDLIYNVASQAHGHLEKSRELQKDIPYNQRRVLLPLVATRLFLEKLQKCNFNIFHEDLLNYSATQNATLPYHIYYNAILGRY